MSWWEWILSLNPLSGAGSSPANDSGMDARVRAYGVDPNTNKWLSPQYDDGRDPSQVAAAARADYTSSYNYFYDKLNVINSQDANNWWQIALYVVLAIVVLILIVKIAE